MGVDKGGRGLEGKKRFVSELSVSPIDFLITPARAVHKPPPLSLKRANSRYDLHDVRQHVRYNRVRLKQNGREVTGTISRCPSS